MEDLKPPYHSPLPFTPSRPACVAYSYTLSAAAVAAARETGTIFFLSPVTTKTSVSATDVWFGYPCERRFKEAENWPDAERILTASSLRDAIMKQKWNLFAYLHRYTVKDLFLLLDGKFVRCSRIHELIWNLYVYYWDGITFYWPKSTRSQDRAIFGRHLTNHYYNGREWSSRVNFYRGISYRRERGFVREKFGFEGGWVLR